MITLKNWVYGTPVTSINDRDYMITYATNLLEAIDNLNKAVKENPSVGYRAGKERMTYVKY